MIDKEKGAALIVTYNRVEKLEKCVKCLLNQTVSINRIYIVNNASTDGTSSFLERISNEFPQIRYLNNSDNCGGAGGFSKGVEWAYEEGADWIWGMDDDAFAAQDAIERLLRERSHRSEICAYWSNVNKDNCFEQDVKEVQEWMFVGFFIPREIIKNVGFPRGDFFIYYDDYEYADRIRKSGYHIYKVKNSIIEHQDAVSNERIWHVWNKNIRVLLLPEQDWKVYYLARNDLLRMQKWDFRKMLAFARNMRRVVKTIVYNPRQLGILLKGIWHGMIGKSGIEMIP